MKQAGRIFKALADPTRREILRELKDGELAAGDLAALFDMTAPSVSRHLSILTAADLIEQRRDGNRILYSLVADHLLQTLNQFLSSVCPTQVSKRKKREGKRASKRGGTR